MARITGRRSGDLVDKVYNANDFAIQVREAYRWNFTTDIAEELIPRFLQRGWLAEIGGTGEGKAYQIVYEPAKNNEPTTETTAIGNVLAEISGAFGTFITEISPLTAYSRTPDELSDILVEWLVSIDAYNEDILRQQVKKFGVDDAGKLGAIEIQPEETSQLGDDDRYLCARFVKKLFSENSPWLPDLCRIASIGLLTEVIQDFRQPLSSVNRSDLSVYLDAPVALDALALSGTAARDNIRPILGELTRIGCQLRIFRTSVDEIQRVLRVVLNFHPADRTGVVASAIRRGEVLERYATSVRDNPETFLSECGIAIVDQSLSQFPNSHRYFPQQINEDLYAAIFWHSDPTPREHDATVMTLVMRRRSDSKSNDVFKTKHLFVTKNGYLRQLARKFCIDRELIHWDQIPPAIHQRQLATMTWLRTGLGADDEVPKRYLLATCERVLELKKGMVDKARQSVSSLSRKQQEQLELLLTEDRSLQMMMDKTLGSSSVVDDGNMPELLEAMKQALVADIRKETRKEVAAVRKDAKAKVATADEARRGAEAKSKDVGQMLRASLADDRRLVQNVVAVVNQRVRRFRWFLNIGVSLILIGIAALPLTTELLTSTLRFFPLTIAGILSAIMGGLQLWDRKTRLGRLLDWRAHQILANLVTDRRLEAKILEHPVDFSSGQFTVKPESPPPSDQTTLL